MKKLNLVVGAGFSGATVARLLAERGERVHVIDLRPHVGGNAYDTCEHGIMVHKYGPHIFHTDDKATWDFFGRWTKWIPYQHKSLASVDGQLVPLPFNLDSLRMLFPKSMAERLEAKLLAHYGLNVNVPILGLREQADKDLQFLAQYVYEKVFLDYTVKQWGLAPDEIDPSVSGRVPVHVSHDSRYFQDRYQGLPLGGYAALFGRMLDHPNITVSLSTPFKRDMGYDDLFWTGSIDEFFDYRFGVLPYRSVSFDEMALDVEWFQPAAIVNYPCDYDFTRITEHKRFMPVRSGVTVITYEYPREFRQGENERFYPIHMPATSELYDKYAVLSKKTPGVHFLGRLGDYRYCSMDQAAARAMALVNGL